MIIVTGGAGFIGSNIVRGLNQKGQKDILVVDDLTDGTKFKYLVNTAIADYWDKDDFLARVQNDQMPQIPTAIIHQGACSTTTEWNGRYMMQNNYEYSKVLFHYCQRYNIPLLYASSAAVYGANTTFKEERANEAPLNVYGYSKWLFDEYVRAQMQKAAEPLRVTGLRYFNVYGPHEEHKGSMASVAYHFYHQLGKEQKVKLFAGCDGYGDGEQRRDFVFINDVVNVNLWFLEQLTAKQFNANAAGIFNVGTGRSQTFNEVADSTLGSLGFGNIEYIPFPDHLKGRYQSFTEADISKLRAAGYTQKFQSVQEGVPLYMEYLKTTG